MLHLYKLIDPTKDLILTDFFEEADEFVNRICYWDVDQEEWPQNYTLNDIIKFSGHNRWISFKRSLETNNSRLLTLIINTDPNNQRMNNMIRLIMSSYQHIEKFIVSRLPSADFYNQWIAGEVKEEGPWDRMDIAFELQRVILTILSKVRNIDPSLIPVSKHITGNDSSHKSSPQIADRRLSAIFQKLLENDYVSLSEDRTKYIWKAENGLYGYFVDIVTDHLKLRPDSNQIPWKMFEGIIENHDKILQTARDRVSKYNNDTLPKPNGYQEIYNIVSDS